MPTISEDFKVIKDLALVEQIIDQKYIEAPKYTEEIHFEYRGLVFWAEFNFESCDGYIDPDAISIGLNGSSQDITEIMGKDDFNKILEKVEEAHIEQLKKEREEP